MVITNMIITNMIMTKMVLTNCKLLAVWDWLSILLIPYRVHSFDKFSWLYFSTMYILWDRPSQYDVLLVIHAIKLHCTNAFFSNTLDTTAKTIQCSNTERHKELRNWSKSKIFKPFTCSLGRKSDWFCVLETLCTVYPK